MTSMFPTFYSRQCLECCFDESESNVVDIYFHDSIVNAYKTNNLCRNYSAIKDFQEM